MQATVNNSRAPSRNLHGVVPLSQQSHGGKTKEPGRRRQSLSRSHTNHKRRKKSRKTNKHRHIFYVSMKINTLPPYNSFLRAQDSIIQVYDTKGGAAEDRFEGMDWWRRSNDNGWFILRITQTIIHQVGCCVNIEDDKLASSTMAQRRFMLTQDAFKRLQDLASLTGVMSSLRMSGILRLATLRPDQYDSITIRVQSEPSLWFATHPVWLDVTSHMLLLRSWPGHIFIKLFSCLQNRLYNCIYKICR